MSVTVDLAVEDPSWAAVPDLQRLVERAVAAALEVAGVAPGEGAELSCLLCGDDAIRQLNRRWRGQDRATNVLSFPTEGPGAAFLLGDIAVSYGTAAREAGAEGKPFPAHLAHLVIHGTLHLVGADHAAEAEAEAMEALEVRAMARLGLPDPYAGTVPLDRVAPAGNAR